ncbi:MAG: arylsulfotransferase family protein [Halioglobus sp.]|nr:arylsulfotransferase family protein [Halioglobus sp.]
MIYQNGLQRYIPKIGKARDGDILHVNDIEPLGHGMADEYPLFEADDLLVSVRNLHLVMVLDPDTREVKWYSTDEWIEQHDPDFIGDGWISVFDNNKNFGGRRTKMLGGSRIVAVQPHTGAFKELYTSAGDDFFYTPRGGKTQHLENGNLLLTEKDTGRVFEVTADGEIVWEWVGETDPEKNTVAEIMEGTRYDFTPQQVAQWPCSPGA